MNRSPFQLLFYTQIGLGIASVASTGSASIISSVLALLAVPLGLYLDSRQQIILPVRYARFVFAALIGFLFLAIFFFGLGWFYAVLELLMLIAGIKLISPKANRDYLQILAIGFLLILISSILTTDALFSLYFVAYIFFLCWTLMVFSVKVVLERDRDPVRSPVATRQAHLPDERSSDLLDKRLFVSSAAVLSIVMIFTVVFFMAFPRFGAGLIGGTIGLQDPSSGLSNTIEFNRFGDIKPDTTIVVRIQVEEGTMSLPAYLRGRTMEKFDGASWSNRQRRIKLAPALDGSSVLPQPWAQPVLRYRMLADDLGVQSMPTLAGTWWLRFKSKFLYSFEDGTVERPGLYRGAFGFTADADPQGYLWAREIVEASEDNAERNLLDLPPNKDHLALHAASFTAVTMLQQAAAQEVSLPVRWQRPLRNALQLSTFLRTRFTYSLRLPEGPDPFVSFVSSRSGHCEFFATLFALSLRNNGIPTRIVSGFAGGAKSFFGNYIAFRNSDAHSWVEAWFAPYGWLAFDPTPAWEPPMPNVLERTWSTMRSAADLYQLWWISRIVNYDLGNQKQLVDSLSGSWNKRRSGGQAARKWLRTLPGWARVAGGGFILVLAWLALRFFLRPSRQSDQTHIPPYGKASRKSRRRLNRIHKKLSRSAGKRMSYESWQTYLDRTHGLSHLTEEDKLWLHTYLNTRYKT